MTDIKVGQLVRITGFHRADAIFGSEWKNILIGKTGRFIDSDLYSLESWFQGTYSGEFRFEPDDLSHNDAKPCFHAVYVEPVEEG